MKDLDDHKKIAVLIDADNTQYSKLHLILDEISAHGHMVIKRAYGDWSSEYLKNWKGILNELAIQPIQQFAYTQGKNATDAYLIIDAMDLLYSGKFDAFVIVSSDSDFTKLASRLRESEIFVFGVGKNTTPVAFRNACDDFIFTENLGSEDADTPQTDKAEKGNQSKVQQLVPVLRKAWERFQDDTGWANVSPVGGFVKRAKPDFDPRSYGVSKLPEVIALLKKDFEMTKYKGKGTVNIIAYRPKKT
ncbi:NYN domain-containing protein [Vibrio parahaemolyticus]|uniref:NYN domain-containing protein n=1 Tax=Vibrio parahaemolyticus TaxID=670 RepID=UPI000B7912B2|nr:NYN domain-containing protein [Vibrio parahaemolyticus]EGQ8136971.1 NYN domain-containing protein [Vibrio parahaemolyticus]EGQ8148795.1 NYN domain-containing protein [Vibrio parahaemolyticus]EGQ8250640.1 NYN domain-containing protein [Vibrio parahaemolyticus]EGQ8265121.1 NYN domain-containing protein [Vibrio parahaemolyticus]EGQ8270693.1 NYN domain-containing protein [Vibrio parahaemolyticus]